MKINLSKISEKQLMTIEIGLIQYAYIQKHYKDNNEDFRDVFNEFYLKSQAAMRKEGNRNPFFDLLATTNPDDSLIGIIEKLYETMETKKYEFSFATKLLHTVNTDSPIYDSKVRSYLKYEEKADLWDIYQVKKDENGNVLSQLEKIKHNWSVLKGWYKAFIGTDTCAEWLEWFDSTFPSYTSISKYKKIDFIIYACSGY